MSQHADTPETSDECREVNTNWLARWQAGNIGWHRDEVHPSLVRYVGDWRRVLVPLCGASLDLAWLAGRGVEVVGIELSSVACQRVFDEAGLVPGRERIGPFEVWRSGRLSIWCGDLFQAPAHIDGGFDAVWDRAALVAIRPDRRIAYADTVAALAPGAEVLLSTLEYDTRLADGPPFSVPMDVVARVYEEPRVLDEGASDKRPSEPGGTPVPMVERAVAARVRAR